METMRVVVLNRVRVEGLGAVRKVAAPLPSPSSPAPESSAGAAHPGSADLCTGLAVGYLFRIPPVASCGWAQGPLRRAFAFSPVAWAMERSASDHHVIWELACGQEPPTDRLNESGLADIDECAAGLPGVRIDQADR